MRSPPSDSTRAVLGVIPARYGASRFPGKPLALLWGRPLLQHVWRRASTVPGLDRLVIATDDERIVEAATGWGAEVERTSSAHATGTDRVAEVARRHAEAGVIVNFQGDEPELDTRAVGRLVDAMRAEPAIPMATLAHPEADAEALRSEHVVKVEVDESGDALYFTREWPPPARGGEVLRHVGVYGFRRAFLLEFASWPPGAAERRERLEQLRAVERGVKVRVILAARTASGVDTPEQLEALERRGPPA
jgi:3-deoxy-manno-octulosonate cytidylyltransferase (CMP-KDO synthetase)